MYAPSLPTKPLKTYEPLDDVLPAVKLAAVVVSYTFVIFEIATVTDLGVISTLLVVAGNT